MTFSLRARRRPWGRGATVAFLAVCCISGCSKEEMKGMAEKVQQKGEQFVVESKKVTDSMVRGPAEILGPTGNISIATKTPIDVDYALAKMHSVEEGRANSFQISSYDPESGKVTLPAVFLYATTEVETVALLAGKSLPCNLFVERGSDSSIARTPVGSPVIITFGSMNMQEKTITATIAPCKLLGSDGNPVDVAGGQILAVVEGQ